MSFLTPPDWLLEPMPGGLRKFTENGGWLLFLAFALFVVLFAFWGLVKRFLTLILSLFRRKPAEVSDPLREKLAEYPPAPPGTGDRRLTVEGVPVRMRLVVLASAGQGSHVNMETANAILDQVLPGLGDLAAQDKPRVRIWPQQLSYEGFAQTFHRSTPIPEGDKVPSPWVLLAGRAKLGKHQVMLGLALQAIKPTTVGRVRLDAHQWTTMLRIRVRD